MIFTTKAEYGVRLLVELGCQSATGDGGGAPVSLKAIAETQGLPLAYLERIVALLRKAELVESTRGAHGGYRLARDAADIRMDEVIIALEGAVAPMTCFVDDTENGRVLCNHEADSGHGCATKLLVDARPGRGLQGAGLDDARRPHHVRPAHRPRPFP